MKGLILSGGKGTRLRPITYTSAKQLVPVANKPVLFYTIENLVGAGITDIGIIVGDTREEIKKAVGDGSKFGCQVTYIHQDQPLGLAHAVKVAQDFIGEERFCMYLGDNMIEIDIKELVTGFAADENTNCRILLKQVADPSASGVAVLEGERVVKLVEKPREFVSDLALVGIYLFDHNIFEAVDNIQPSWRNELEITDAIQYLVTRGYMVRPYIVPGWWIDTGKQEEMLEVNRLVLDRLPARNDGFVDADSQIDGKVIIEQGAEIINSRVRGPAIIGEHTRIVNSYIGPFTSIYHHCKIEQSEVEHSIILENCEIVDLPSRLADSLIGRNVELGRSAIKPKAFKMTLGDNSKVGVL